ncbi:hypothetical protein RHGRI_014042 [Rhododendron griersonianum]|uniref:Uncharacterized protein n=1 Tax=Rhododendron griersonianum TaxID=479676 RepID=A0AAV6K8C4_9ERIC|nr:hypothetical protein RHGRI_014042 [Rhododendron griersonianum]
MKPDYQKSHKRGKVGYMVLWLVCEREGGGFKQRRRIEGTNGLSNLDLLLLALARLGIRRMCSKSERGTWLTGSCKRYNVRYPAMYASKSVRKDVKLFNCSQKIYTRKVENKNHLVNLVPSTLYAIVVDE